MQRGLQAHSYSGRRQYVPEWGLNLTPDWENRIATEGEERREDEPCSFSEKTPFASFWRIKGLARKAHDVFKGPCLPREINPLKNAQQSKDELQFSYLWAFYLISSFYCLAPAVPMGTGSESQMNSKLVLIGIRTVPSSEAFSQYICDKNPLWFPIEGWQDFVFQ